MSDTHYPPVLVVPTQAGANPEDLEALKAAGVLLLRCEKPSAVEMRPAMPRFAYSVMEEASIRMVQYMLRKENNGIRWTNLEIGEWLARIALAVERGESA